MKAVTVLITCFLIYVTLSACPADMSSAGVILNNGEHFDFLKIEALGKKDINYFKEEIIPIPVTVDSIVSNDSVISDEKNILKKPRRIPLQSEATLISHSFKYEPDASTSFSPEPMFAFKEDTLIINDYWALSNDALFLCSLNVSNDTFHISYLPVIETGKDWMPTIQTVLRIKLNTTRKNIVLHFNAVKNARPPFYTQTGIRYAGTDFFSTVPVPPLCTYKYRAHSCPSTMVYLHYEQTSKDYRWICPKITITIDSSLAYSDTSIDFAEILMNELLWLKELGICIPSQKTIDMLSSAQTTSGGWCFWSKQDTTLGLNQFFSIDNNTLNVWNIRTAQGGCGLGTDFQIPPEPLQLTKAKSYPVLKDHISTRFDITAQMRNNTLNIVSSRSFNQLSVYNYLGQEIFSQTFPVSGKTIALPIISRFIRGNYIVVTRSRNHKASCRLFVY